MIQEFTSSVFYSAWPFWALSLPQDASAQDITQAVRNLDAQLKLGVEQAKYFDTPLGVRVRDEYLLREAKAILDDPQQRLIAELWFIPARTDENNNGGPDQVAGAENMNVKIQWYDELKLP